MGRAKLKMELIEKEKSRNTTFKKRKEGLIRKLHEFTTLCDVKACMIMYGPNHRQNDIVPEIWPPHNPDQVRRIIDLYKSKNSGGIKSFGVVDFFHDRKKQIEEEVAKLRRKNLEAKYPTKPELLTVMSEPQLREFHALLRDKLNRVQARVELLKGKKQQAAAASMAAAPAIPQSHFSAAAAADHHRARVEFGVMSQKQAAVDMLLDHHRMQPRLHALNHNSSMMMQFERQVFYEMASGFYAAPPPQQQAYMLPPPTYMLPAVVPAQLQCPPSRDSSQEDFVQHQIRNEAARNQNDDGGVQDEELVANKFFYY